MYTREYEIHKIHIENNTSKLIKHGGEDKSLKKNIMIQTICIIFAILRHY